MPLNPSIHEFLLILERAAGEWVAESQVAHIPADDRFQAVRAGWVKERGFGARHDYKILPSGYTALGEHAGAALKEMRAEPQPANGRIKSLVRPYTPDQIVDAVVQQSLTDPDDDPSVIYDGPEISVSLYGETLGVDEPEAAKPECIDRCGQPRWRNFTRCEECQKRFWRNAKKTKTARRKANPAPVRIAEPPTTEADTQPVRFPVDTTPPIIRIAARAAVGLIVLRSRLAGSR